MIKRRRYGKEFKKQIAMEIISKVSTFGQVSKREGIAYQTLKNWVGEILKGDALKDDREVLRLKQENSALKIALSESILENQILKKTEVALQEMMRDGHLSEKDLYRSLES